MDITEKRKVELLNTSLNRLRFTGSEFNLESWGDVSHLQNQKSLDEVDSGKPSVPWLLP
jgi:probable phosphoglycerate mutase